MPIRQSIVTTDAIVLRSMSYGETSQIATLLTVDFGKISVIGRGVRHPKSKFGSTLEPLAYIQAVIYMKPARDLQSISDACHIRSFPAIRGSLDHLEIGLRIVELAGALMQEGEPNPAVFTLLVSALTALGTSPDEVSNLLPFFQLRIASILGFAPGFTKAEVESLSTDRGVLDVETGRILPNGPAGIRTTRATLRAFAILARASLPTVLHMKLSEKERGDLADLITGYMRFHFEDVYPHRSERIFAQIVNKRT